MDRDQAELAYGEIVDTWLRDELGGEEGGLLAELVLHDPHATSRADPHRYSGISAGIGSSPPTSYRTSIGSLPSSGKVVDDFGTFTGRDAVAKESETTRLLPASFRELAGEVVAALPADTATAPVALLVMAPHLDLLTRSGSFRKYQKKAKWGAAAKHAGLAKADAERLNDAASAHYARCCATWTALQQDRRHPCDRRSRALAHARHGPVPRPQARRRVTRLRRPDIRGARSSARP